MQRLLWIDVETTGLDPKENDLLEVAAVVTDEKCHVVSCFQGVLVGDEEQVDRLRFNDFTRRMHTENGLIRELTMEPTAGCEAREVFMPGSLAPLDLDSGRFACVNELEEELENWYRATLDSLYTRRGEAIPRRGLPLAGSNPGFDRGWLEEWMPAFAKSIHYRSFDMNTLYYFFESVKSKDDGPRDHRALGDLFADIDKLQEFRSRLQSAEEKAWQYDELCD